jgi:hypothetical protein
VKKEKKKEEEDGVNIKRKKTGIHPISFLSLSLSVSCVLKITRATLKI